MPPQRSLTAHSICPVGHRIPFRISLPIETMSTGVRWAANAAMVSRVYSRTVRVRVGRSWPTQAAGVSWCCGSAQKSE